MTLEPFLIFSIALSSSFGHCIGMCGGIALSINSTQAKNNILRNLLYNTGRVTTYTLLGAFFGSLGYVFNVSPTIKAYSFILIGVVIILFLILPKINILNFVYPAFLKSFFSHFIKSQKLISVYFIGIVNGFLPCGIVYYFALIASSTNNPLEGMLVMFIFGIGSFVPMFLFGYLSSILVVYKNVFLKLSFFLMFLFAIFTIYKGAILLK